MKMITAIRAAALSLFAITGCADVDGDPSELEVEQSEIEEASAALLATAGGS
jgi:hypothetical protein